jgi:hypothetical protein
MATLLVLLLLLFMLVLLLLLLQRLEWCQASGLGRVWQQLPDTHDRELQTEMRRTAQRAL